MTATITKGGGDMSHKSLAQQFSEHIRPITNKLSEKVSEDVAVILDKQMKENTQEGRAFGADPYDNSYSTSHRNARRKRGLQTGRVDLRYTQRRIEKTRIETTSGKQAKATIRFADGGDIFKLHHDGTAKGNKIRSIWPKSPESIPDHITQQVKQIVGEVLRGQK